MRAVRHCVLYITLLAVVLAGATAILANPALDEGIRLGLLDGLAATAYENGPVTQETWTALVREAFGPWLDAGVATNAGRPPIPASGPAIAGLAINDTGGAIQAPVTEAEARASLRALVQMIRRKLGWGVLTSREGLRLLLRSPLITWRLRGSPGGRGDLVLERGLELVRWLIGVLPCPPGTPEPAQAIRSYYSSLSELVVGPMRPGTSLQLPVCGLAAANLDRNAGLLRALAGGQGVCFALASLETESVRRTGMLAEVTVTRRMITVVGQRHLEDSGRDTFRLRLSARGWLIYE